MEIIVWVEEMGVGSLGVDGDRNLGRNTEELSVRLWWWWWWWGDVECFGHVSVLVNSKVMGGDVHCVEVTCRLGGGKRDGVGGWW